MSFSSTYAIISLRFLCAEKNLLATNCVTSYVISMQSLDSQNFLKSRTKKWQTRPKSVWTIYAEYRIRCMWHVFNCTLYRHTKYVRVWLWSLRITSSSSTFSSRAPKEKTQSKILFYFEILFLRKIKATTIQRLRKQQTKSIKFTDLLFQTVVELYAM